MFSFLDYRSALRLHCTGDEIFRPKLLRSHIGRVDKDDHKFVKSEIKHADSFSIKIDNGDLDDFYDVSPMLSRFVTESHNLRLLVLNVHVHFNKIVEFLPLMLEKIVLTSTVQTTSLFERFIKLVDLTLWSFEIYDKPLPSSLRTLKIEDPDDRTRDFNEELYAADKRVDFRIFAPNLTRFISEESFVDCIHLPASLLDLKVNNVRDPENLATSCPRLQRMRSVYLDYERMKLPKSLTRISYNPNSADLGFEKVENIAEMLSGLLIDVEGGDIDDPSTGFDLATVAGRGDGVNLMRFEGATKIIRFANSISKVRMSNVADAATMLEIPRITDFPSSLVKIHITTMLFPISTLMKLPDSIETVYICATMIHDPCDLTAKKSLRDMTLDPLESAVPFCHSIKLPSSLRIYANHGAVMSVNDMPLPNLSYLRVGLITGFDLRLLPITIDTLVITGTEVKSEYDPIRGYRWSYENIYKKMRREIHFSGLVYMPIRKTSGSRR